MPSDNNNNAVPEEEKNKNWNAHYKDPWHHSRAKTVEGYDRVSSPTVSAIRTFFGTVFDAPTSWWREHVMTPFQGPKYNYYHQSFRRVPTIDQCYTDDFGCFVEANEQYKRDFMVDEQILDIVKERSLKCEQYWQYEQVEAKCAKEREDWYKTALNYFIKYGDLGYYGTVIDAYMKQKHRLIWERREREREQRLKEKFPHLHRNSE